MTTAEAIYAKLAATTAVTDLVSTRIYPVTAPEGATAPYVIFQGIASDPAVTHAESAGATFRLFQFACFAATFEAADALRAAVVAALDGVDLANGDNGTLEDDARDDYDDVAALYRCDADITF